MHKNKRDILKLLIDISIIQQKYCKTEVYCKVSSMYIYFKYMIDCLLLTDYFIFFIIFDKKQSKLLKVCEIHRCSLIFT